MRKLLLFFSLFVAFSMHSQEYFPTNTGVKSTFNKTVAFKNATIYVTPQKIITKGILLIKEGKVLSVGKSVSIPKGTEIIDLEGKIIYPSFIDMYASFGIEKPKKSPSSRRNEKPQYDATRKGFYWNDHIRPETKAENSFKFDDKKATDYLKAGFGVVNTHLQDGIVRGNGMLVALNPNSSDAYRILENSSAQYLSFSKSTLSKQAYPTSKMGAMALLRQMYLDAKWYADGNAKNKDQSLEALNANKSLLQIFEAGSWLDILRADKIGDEFNIQYTILGGGDEYERIDEIKNTNASLIIPINFQDAYDVSNPLIAKQIALGDLRRWNQQPTNLSVLAKNGINFALTTHKLKKTDDFLKNLQKAIKYGLNEEKALEALTTIPAKLLGKTTIGNLNKGSYANFIITSGAIFDSKTTIYENWVQGDKNVVNDMDIKDITGDYTISVNGKYYSLIITGKGAKQTGVVKKGDEKLKATFSFKDGRIHLTINDEGYTRLIGQIINASNVMQGTAYDEAGNESGWSASKTFKKEAKNKEPKKKKEDLTILPISYPNIGFGNFSLPKQETILIKNATVWTSENDGILENTDILIKEGKIAEIGKNLKSRAAKTIDGTGKYVTAGIIDEHSHIATSAVNEAGHNSTAEVSIEDVVNPNDINIYRNLAGGVTSIQILHGSANPIGGRSAIIKLKWGENVEGLIYKNSPKFIKFALGENVKQSNWGESNTIRFPQTRMGTEQVFIDYFQRAKEYDALKKSGKPYRKDIEMETLAEILNKERFISCHSYVQSEINMLMKVAEKFNFNINTFTHILEGYKVADKMKEHGVGASTFSDWWAYKYEVLDAIPYNAAIMHNQGITVAINSDDREMSRRLNQEAAKTIKYGGMSELEAWKMVTINPAKLLHLDNRTGSIKIGKDGDVVVWSANPLSIYAKAEKTIIDGVIYFDIEKDVEKRKSIKEEKSKLLKMMLSEKMKGGKTVMPKKKSNQNFHCDTL
ncbi:amidohydrolase family protein [Polaribacter sp. Z014]|uniref:amidohydrolase family protein n=1 Tax=Polaribacter sp. Z014 TaxID=2927126 RepID=UPI00202202C7|nr:amidohydrolase family protein [Polaribacter sp. Z014]MCL7762786.1 amidohydrolase family protein [Polaribacter sp. Z014]